MAGWSISRDEQGWRIDIPEAGGIVRSYRPAAESADLAVLAAERLAATAPHAAAHEAAHPSIDLESCLVGFLDSAPLDKAARTVGAYRLMAGHLARLCGAVSLSQLRVDAVAGYIGSRLSEGAARETVRKELCCLRQALRWAKQRGHLAGVDLSDLFPAFSAPYRPRDRYLTLDQALALLDCLPLHRRRWVLLAAWAGLRLGEVERLQWADVDFDRQVLRVRGSKTPGSFRLVGLAPALAEVLQECRAVRGPVVRPWSNVRRDLAIACRAAGVDRVTPNDLRRTFASWLVQAGRSNFVVSRLLGHTSTKMVDLVYGQLGAAALIDAVDCLPAVRSAEPTAAKARIPRRSRPAKLV